MTTSQRSTTKQTLFKEHFSNLKDPRCTYRGNLKHFLSDIMLLTISAVLCGADSWKLIEVFGESQLEWLKKHGEFTNDIPSSYTIERVFTALDPNSFNTCFINWIESIRKKVDGEVVAIDGKSIRGANPKKNGNKMPHIVSAFASNNGITLGQVTVDEKSNEITAIPTLLKLIAIEGCTITIDAMGCQRAIAEDIIDNGGNYILAVKGNQSNLEQSIIDTIRFEKPVSIDVEDDLGHGRVEKRTCYAYSSLSHVENVEKWKNLKTLIRIESEVYHKTTRVTTKEQRYYISDLPPVASTLNRRIRQHWSVENNLHWTLDVEFGEDKSRKRNGYSAENYNIILKTALTMLANDKSKKLSKKSKRMKAALDYKYRESLLNF